MDSILDVIVVGAGPTGLMLGRELRLAGVVPLVLERLSERGGIPKALGLAGRTLDILERRGLLERFEAAARQTPALADPALVSRLMHFGGMPIEIARLTGSPPRFLNLMQDGAERCFEACALDLGVSICRGHEVTALRQEFDHVALTVETADGAVELRARFVVGCDGAHSAVRKLAGIGFPGTAPTQVLRLGDLALPPALADRGAWAGGRAPLVPLAGGWTRVVTKEALPPDFDGRAPMTFAELKQSVRRVHGVDLPVVKARWLSRFTDTSRLAERYRDGRVLLAGDAAHVHLPAGGPGINAGINDAINLGWKLARTVLGTAPDGLLDTYHGERHPAGERLMMHTRAQGAMLHATHEATALRELVSELMQQGSVLRHVVDLLQGNDVDYGSAGRTSGPLCGRWAPNLAFTDGDAAAQRLSDLMHDGHGLFLDLGEQPSLRARVASTAHGVDIVVARAAEPPATAMLVRPDGHIAWARAPSDDDARAEAQLQDALDTWFAAA